MMSAATSRSEPRHARGADAALAAALAPVRVDGAVRVRIARGSDGRSSAVERAETGGLRVRVTRPPRDGDAPLDLVLLNTAGGLAGGDRVATTVRVDDGATARVTTPAAERVYRSLGPAAVLGVSLSVGRGARLDWLPQETIVYGGGALTRRLDVDLGADARLLVAEILVFGRQAMGEALGRGPVTDRWRILREGRLQFAEHLRLDDDLDARLDRAALGGGARAVATVLLLAPEAEAVLPELRARLAATVADPPILRIAASAWNGMLCLRALAPGAEPVRRAVAIAAAHLAGRPMPRSWAC